MNESQIQDAVRLALGKVTDVVMFRNNVGVAQHWNGREVEAVRYGLANGSADLVGVLAPSGRWVALEVKAPKGRTTDEQDRWLALVRKMGGFACVVHSVDEALAALDRARAGGSE